jgi:hypothetical protein
MCMRGVTGAPVSIRPVDALHPVSRSFFDLLPPQACLNEMLEAV